jgi:hypothetical protein
MLALSVHVRGTGMTIDTMKRGNLVQNRWNVSMLSRVRLI